MATTETQATFLRDVYAVVVRAEAVFEMRVMLGLQPPPAPDFVIDEPFLVWFQRSGLSAPLFVAHVTREAWRNPGDLASRLSRPGTE